MSNAEELRDLLTRTAQTGDAPTNAELMSIGLSGTLDERKKARAAITNAAQQLARYAGRKDPSVGRRVDDLVARFAGAADMSDPEAAAAAAGVPRENKPWDVKRGHNAEPSAVRTLTDALNRSSVSKQPLTPTELAKLEPSAIDPKAASKWRADVYEASQEVAREAATGNHSDAWSTARELAGGLAGGLSMPQHFDQEAEDTDDPAELAALVHRRNGTFGR